MEQQRSGSLKWLLLGLGVLLAWQFGGSFFHKPSALQPLTINDATAPAKEARTPEQTCALEGPRFKAEFSSQGASARRVELLDTKYQDGSGAPINLVTTTLEARMPLRTDLRLPQPGAADNQVPFDDLDWILREQTKERCVFVFESDEARLTKTLSVTGRPFEIQMALEVANKATAPRKHRLTVEQTAWRKAKELESHLGRQSEFMTQTVAATDQETFRKAETDFEPDDFKPADGFTPEGWWRAPGVPKYVATSSVYFSSALLPAGTGPVHAETQIEEVWANSLFPDKSKDPNHGFVFRSRLAFEERELSPGASAHYEALAYMGPKERSVLANVGGQQDSLSDVIDLGTFATIGRFLVGYVLFLRGLVGHWGWAICLLTVTVRLALTPLSLGQIKSGLAMRRLKPEMDAINAKYKDDAAQRGLAIQELWRKHGVLNPIVGCIPVLLQMPVWFALYTALQTAVELYHEPFGPFIPDLSAPGRYFIIPVVLAASSFFQMKIMPQQGDAAQQKMMTYMMPAIFLVMMLFLPAGLGVYMLTNTWLGIVQQLAVEKYYAKGMAAPREIVVQEKKA